MKTPTTPPLVRAGLWYWPQDLGDGQGEGMGQPVLHPWGRALPRGENVARGTSLPTRLPKSRGEVEAAEELGWTRLPSAGLLPCPPFAHPCSWSPLPLAT